MVDSLSESTQHLPYQANTSSSKPNLQGNASIVARIRQKAFQLAPEQQGAKTKQTRNIFYVQPRCEAAPLHATSDKSSSKLGNAERAASLLTVDLALLARKLEPKPYCCCTSACATEADAPQQSAKKPDSNVASVNSCAVRFPNFTNATWPAFLQHCTF